MVTGHAAVALAGAVHEEHLRTGMSRCDLIGQAEGIPMEPYGLTADQSCGMLARVSQETAGSSTSPASSPTPGLMPRATGRQARRRAGAGLRGRGAPGRSGTGTASRR
ncbi:hypothetical protein [Blastococcus goldschmidtiae]|uniref:Uncharacterized protein n=1 Tax=Blastococcus goldschmidtiae TaxID=3075546 RepID=A0ABU2KB06_9ACTN|nr:hypothetical protein [Blastococcus sp. DSM 46792]MDT0277367.1 hypothetical protein [Blastococcus sp. DSM 46792]